MKVIVCGAGQVGFNIARHLAEEGNDVTVIDQSDKLIRQISEQLDVKAIVGYASDPAMLARAGASDADILIAVTWSDEVNMIACQVAHSLFTVPTKVARIRNQTYLKPMWADLFSRENLPIDVIISPELEVAKALHRRLEVPGAFNMLPFAGGRVRVIGLKLEPHCPVLETPLRQLTELFPNLQTNVIAIVRGERFFVPSSSDHLQSGDHIYIALEKEMTERIMSVFGHDEKAAQRIVIIGGGNIGFFLAERLEKQKNAPHVKILEKNKERANQVAEKLKNAVVINGDALEPAILTEANISESDVTVAVVDDDEVNIIASLLAKREGSSRVITLLTNTVYNSLTGSLGIDVALDPRETTVSSILRHIRRGRVRDLYSLHEGEAEIIELDVIEGSQIAGQRIRDLRLHGEVRVGVLLRDDEVIVPDASTLFEAGDRVVLLTLSEAVRKVEQLFSPRADIF